MKKFAFYLPQFHQIPENDEWWGEGFTEWTNVKKAKILFKGHDQPKVPFNQNYYNLLNKDTIIWQTNLVNEYKLDGLIYYHYYFNGKKLLEKPAEILLSKPDILLKFFFCWANHSWYRSWEGSKELLQEQVYGDKSDWENHFQYLLQFFKDNRYEKYNNRPILMIFKSNFEEKDDILCYFNQRCIDNGFAGLCAIETYENYDKNDVEDFLKRISSCTEFIHLREPGSVLKCYRASIKNIFFKIKNKIGKSLNGRCNINYIEKYNGNALFNLMNEHKFLSEKIIRGLFFEWDNTPRHSSRGYVISPPDKIKLFRYLDSIKNNEFVFINAWNEWCEGMILEPTEKNKYKYLEWIKEWSEKNDNRSDGV